MITTINFPAFSVRFATSSAAQVAAPEEMRPINLPRVPACAPSGMRRHSSRDDLIVDLGIEDVRHETAPIP